MAIIGITVDNRDNAAASGKYEAAIAYTRAVSDAGGSPVLLPHESDRVDHYLALCDGLILTGGGDPAMETFGQSTDTRARVIDPARQQFELGLLQSAAEHRPDLPVLGICLGMQLMALHAGGALDQYLPESMGETAAAVHQHDNRHALSIEAADSVLVAGLGPEAWGLGAEGSEGKESGQVAEAPTTRSPDFQFISNQQSDMRHQTSDIRHSTVVSSHRQAITDPGSLRVVATAADETIEAIDDPGRAFYLGVQWHPERGRDGASDELSLGLIRRFVAAADCPR
jgi:putative glutamine amidotransferase